MAPPALTGQFVMLQDFRILHLLQNSLPGGLHPRPRRAYGKRPSPGKHRAGRSSPNQNPHTIAVVTGSNKGLGFAIAQGLALKGVMTVLTARDEQRGLAALNSLKQDQRINPATLQFHVLDVRSTSSIQNFAKWIETKFGGLDILVNNAGISRNEHLGNPTVEGSKDVISTNFYGTRMALRNQTVVQKVSKLSMETLDEVVGEFIEDVEHGRLIVKGWTGIFGAYDYCLSKLLLNAYSRVLARDLSKQGGKFFVNCMCPGLTSTDMSRNNGHSAQIGADTVIWLALLPASKSTTGRFFSNRQDVGFDHIPLYLEKGTYSKLLDEFDECIRTSMPPLHPVFLKMY
ncbi:(+)-neomenthol dehydrogenase [Selaginella moellendorffii]|uniref:(+)-neomenthol dehydrogenase n=1 Tax=Selaginella moellendorffii TaxID=88036 RepID=UPI000D1C52BE|nr:(+)-neomenthol dehydrogenase [Selaginella moellendorffii]|eukprot:XP_024516765.1 (+)-neomenthol dehydrogenase [Selaginella moellendorffii]